MVLPLHAHNYKNVTGNRPYFATINSLLRKQILPARPERVTHIEARYKLDDSSSSELSLEGYLQHSSGINRYQLKRWFDAACQLIPSTRRFGLQYVAYSHAQIFGTPKLGTGGTGDRKRTSNTVCAHLLPHFKT